MQGKLSLFQRGMQEFPGILRSLKIHEMLHNERIKSLMERGLLFQHSCKFIKPLFISFLPFFQEEMGPMILLFNARFFLLHQLIA